MMPNRSIVSDVVAAPMARALLLEGLGLGGERTVVSGPASGRLAGRGSGLASVSRATLRMIESIGFVQVDSINVVERAHHHILWTRVPGYAPSVLEGLLKRGRVFEQWTHDASIIPSIWFPHWRPRFERRGMGAWVKQRLGKDADRVLGMVRGRIEAEGPLMSKHFEEEGRKSGGWWEWAPSKAALEHLWRAGELTIAGRVNFHKVYDLTHRALPKAHALASPTEEEHVEWACRTAIERLGVATSREVMQFWNAIDQKRAHAWCEAAADRGELVRVTIESLDGAKPKAGYAIADWKKRAAKARAKIKERALSGELRLLSPFDPLVRDRARCGRLFGFQYNFEAYVPEKKRKFGYFVLPILDGDRLIGRLHPKADRESGRLLVRGVWWEPGVRETKLLRRRLDEVLWRYAVFNGVNGVERADPA